MSPQNPSMLVGLAAPGLLWLATSVAFGQAVPPPRAPSPAPTYAALLLSNGKVVRGEIVQDAAAGVYRLRQSGGSVPFPSSMVEKAAGSVEELYQFRVSRLAAGDSDERIKLARWCLTERLPAQAREQLLAVQAMGPSDEVDRMLRNLSANAGASRGGTVDEAARQVGFEAPVPLNPQVIVRARKNYGNALPVIFDLPPAQAVPRAAEFARHVQPILLQNCARCHNERYPGLFQLVEIKSSRDKQNSDIARANLDATLRLINPDDPSRSELLSAGLVPHGPTKNAIFSGPNNPSYQILATWTKSLRSPSNATARPPAGPLTRTGFAGPEPATAGPIDGFGTDRGGQGPSGRAPAPAPLPGLDVLSAGRAAMPPPQSRRIVNKYEENADFSGNSDAEFQLPFSAGGAPPVPAPPVRQSPRGAKVPVTPPVPTTNATPVAPGTVSIGATDDPNLLPGMNQPLYPTSAGADSPAKKNKPKIDNALLEKMMKNRNANP